MKRLVSVLILVTVVALGIFTISREASAEEIKMVGVITKIEMAGKDALLTYEEIGLRGSSWMRYPS